MNDEATPIPLPALTQAQRLHIESGLLKSCVTDFDKAVRPYCFPSRYLGYPLRNARKCS